MGTKDNSTKTNSQEAFLTTYRTFIAPELLIAKLVYRWCLILHNSVSYWRLLSCKQKFDPGSESSTVQSTALSDSPGLPSLSLFVLSTVSRRFFFLILSVGGNVFHQHQQKPREHDFQGYLTSTRWTSWTKAFSRSWLSSSPAWSSMETWDWPGLWGLSCQQLRILREVETAFCQVPVHS